MTKAFVLEKTINSPVGPLLIKANPRGVQSVEFIRRRPIKNLELDKKQTNKTNKKLSETGRLAARRHLAQCIQELNEYFAGTRTKFDVKLNLIGTDFQVATWKVLKKIPFGKTISYKMEAERLGRPTAFRAVAGANGKNPIPIIVPCHRVISSEGRLHGFSSGVDLKEKLLEFEGVQVPR